MEPENIIEKLPKRRCRDCVNFIRINEPDKVVYSRRGFCLYGRLEGEWSLYISSSTSGDCQGFIFSIEHNRITNAERALQQMEREFIHKCHDRRTKEYKLIKPLLEATKEYGSTIWDRPGLNEMKAFFKVDIIVKQYLREEHRETYRDVRDMVSLWKDHYMKFMAQLSIEIHDRFCDCDKLVFHDPSEINLLKEGVEGN